MKFESSLRNFVPSNQVDSPQQDHCGRTMTTGQFKYTLSNRRSKFYPQDCFKKAISNVACCSDRDVTSSHRSHKDETQMVNPGDCELNRSSNNKSFIRFTPHDSITGLLTQNATESGNKTFEDGSLKQKAIECRNVCSNDSQKWAYPRQTVPSVVNDFVRSLDGEVVLVCSSSCSAKDGFLGHCKKHQDQYLTNMVSDNCTMSSVMKQEAASTGSMMAAMADTTSRWTCSNCIRPSSCSNTKRNQSKDLLLTIVHFDHSNDSNKQTTKSCFQWNSSCFDKQSHFFFALLFRVNIVTVNI